MRRPARRSQHVLAPILAATAAALSSGCHQTQPMRCVDEQGRIVDPHFCNGLQPGQTAVGNTYNNGGYYNNNVFYPHIFRYYYGGSGGSVGTFVSGGSFAPSSGASYSSGTSRGGFGSSFSGAGSGHAGGSGE